MCWGAGSFGCSCRRAALCGLHATVVLLVRLCCFSLCVGGGRARRLHTCMQCVPLACPGFGTGWRVPGSVSASSATAAVGTRQLALYGSRHVRIMPCACLPLSLCVCRQLPDSCCFGGMLQLGRWGQPPAVQVRGFFPRIDVGHVTPSSSSSSVSHSPLRAAYGTSVCLLLIFSLHFISFQHMRTPPARPRDGGFGRL